MQVDAIPMSSALDPEAWTRARKAHGHEQGAEPRVAMLSAEGF